VGISRTNSSAAINLILGLLDVRSRRQRTPGTVEPPNPPPDLIAYLDQRLGEIERRFGEIDRRFDDADRQLEELRRHFDVVAESLMSKIELVGEGVRTVDQKLDRLAGETRGEFERIDRRFLHLTASLSPRRRP